MARISDEDIQKVREATDLAELVGERVPLRPKGRELWGCCPFHNEKTPSFKVDPATQLWHCFGCGEGGDVFGYVMRSDDVSFPDAIRYLAERAHIDIVESGGPSVSTSEKARLRDVCSETKEFYHRQLMRGKSEEAQRARDYLASRDLGGSIPKEWSLGFAPGRGALVSHLRQKGFSPREMIAANVAVDRKGTLVDRFYDRVMFPIDDIQGECIAFGGRVIGQGEPKYLNSQDTPLFHKSNVLYGLDKAKASMTATGDALVVEGYTDVIALHRAGIKNAVATLGTALTLQHIRALSRHAKNRIIYLFDGDAAGQRAADRALGFINEDMTPEAGKARVELFAVTLPDDLDPADFIEQRGAEALRDLLADAMPLVSYGIERRLSSHDLRTAEGRTRAFTDALSILAPIKDSLLAKDYAVQLAGRLQMREEDALNALSSLKAPIRDRSTDAVKTDRTATNGTRPEMGFSEAEKSRRRSERKLLSLLAQNPPMALDHATELAETHWHDPMNATLANSMLEVLSKDPSADAATLIATVADSVNGASAALTSANASSGSLESTISFLAEELEIGDMEDQVSSMNAMLKDDSTLSQNEHEIIFRSLVELQKTLAAKRAAHRPYIP